MRSLTFLLRSGLALVALTAAGSAQQAWVVDNSGAPGADFAQLDSAVQAAADGDVLLVRSTGLFYFLFQVLDGRGLTIVADGGPVSVISTLAVRNLAPDQRVVLRGLEFYFDDGLILESNQGLVWIEDCRLLADNPGCFGCPVVAAVDASDTPLVLLNSELSGATPWLDRNIPVGPGLRLQGATAALLGGTVQGGLGEDYGGLPSPGGVGLEATGSFFLASQLEIQGGQAAPLSETGGNGMELLGGSTGWLRATTPQGGFGTPFGLPQVVDGASVLATRSHRLPTLEASSPVRGGETLDLTFRGAPGETFLLRVGLEPALDWEPETASFRLVDALPALSLFLGVVPASGVASASIPLPALGAAPFRELFLQVQQPTVHHLRRTGTPAPRWSTATAVLQLP